MTSTPTPPPGGDVKDLLRALMATGRPDPMRQVIEDYKQSLQGLDPSAPLSGRDALNLLMPVFSAILSAQIDCAKAAAASDQRAGRRAMYSIGLANDALNSLAQALEKR